MTRLRVMCFSVVTSVLAAVVWLGGKKEDLLVLLPVRRRVG